jgi:2-methylcitrate dehydratase PrpD
MGPTEELSKFIANTTFEDLSETVVHQTKNAIMDALGCGIAGYKTEHEKLAPLINVVRSLKGEEESTVIVDGFRTSCICAALANGAIVHSIDYDDTNFATLVHTGSAIIPSVLALAERQGASGEDVITATVLGYEVAIKVGKSVMPTHYQFWHSTGTNGTLGAAAAAGKLLGLDADQMNQALGIAADQAAGLISCIEFGDLTKSLHPGLAAMKGILGALIIRSGGSGPRGILEYSRGYCNAYSDSPKLNELTERLGMPFEISSNSFKAYPSVLASHSAIEATLGIIAENKIRVEDIVQITEKTYDTAATSFCNYNPKTALAARLSLPYCIAAAAIDGQVGANQFSKERVFDPRIRELMKKVKIDSDAELTRLYPEKFPARVEVTTEDGKRSQKTVLFPKGLYKNPMTDDELRNKFRNLASLVFGAERVERILGMIDWLDDMHSISALISMMVE